MFELIIKHDHSDDKSFITAVSDAVFGNHKRTDKRFLCIGDRVVIREKNDQLVIEIATENKENFLLKFDMDDANIQDV